MHAQRGRGRRGNEEGEGEGTRKGKEQEMGKERRTEGGRRYQCKNTHVTSLCWGCAYGIPPVMPVDMRTPLTVHRSWTCAHILMIMLAHHQTTCSIFFCFLGGKDSIFGCLLCNIDDYRNCFLNYFNGFANQNSFFIIFQSTGRSEREGTLHGG